MCRCLKVLARLELGSSSDKSPEIERACHARIPEQCPVVLDIGALAYAATEESRRYRDDILVSMYRGREQRRRGWRGQPITAKRVRSIAVEQQDKHLDDRVNILKAKIILIPSRLLGQPRSTKVWRVQLFTPGTVNTICIRSEQVQRSANHWVVASVIDYCPESCLISRITVYSSHSFAVPSTGSVDNYNVLTDISMKFFGNWTSSLDTSYRGGTKLCMLGMRPGMGNKMRVTYISSKGDQQFVFGAATGDPSDYTANELVWITQEPGVPTDYLSDTYVDFEVAVLDLTTTAVEWKLGIGQIKQFNFVEKNNMLYVKPKKSVPFDKLADGVCLFSFACYNSCLEYKNDSYRKGRLIKSGLQVLFTVLDGNRTVLREDSVDLRVCAFSTQDTLFIVVMATVIILLVTLKLDREVPSITGYID